MSDAKVPLTRFTTDELKMVFAKHCECRPLDTMRTEDDHSHDCDTGVLELVQTIQGSVCFEEEQRATFELRKLYPEGTWGLI